VKNIVVTGAAGFIGKNLCLRLSERPEFQVRPILSSSTPEELELALSDADGVVHLAGVNRPVHADDFLTGNRNSIAAVTEILSRTQRSPAIILTSSTRAAEATPYGESKRAGEQVLLDFAERTGAMATVLRLPNVFGKWARPNYNSAVATFCHNIARDLPITVNDPQAPLQLIYVDDVVDQILALLTDPPSAAGFHEPASVYETKVGEVADLIARFHAGRRSAMVETVGEGLVRALYATYVAALPSEAFSYGLKSNVDDRGAFSEILKTVNSGQFSFLTAHPNVTRGGHYHHTKIEKFVVVQGEALFRFRHMLTGEFIEIRVSGDEPTVVETIPGWTHDITNVGSGLMISMLWANEIFSPARPDTIAARI
jgi:UDP-2-acetamido-2,6-beta-L-arabino-hexul-4-ose reductase